MAPKTDPRLMQMADTLEALNISKSILYFLIHKGIATREDFMEVLQSFTKCAPEHLVGEMQHREEELNRWIRMLPVEKKRSPRGVGRSRAQTQSGGKDPQDSNA